MTKFIFVRHGESEANRDFKLGALDTKLTQKGIEQAHQTGKELKGKGIKIIACSTFVRAQQTAEIIAGELGIPVDKIKVIYDLAERRMGKYEGKTKEHPTEWYYSPEAENPEFEPRADLLKRMHKTLNEIEELSKGGMVLVVGHALSGLYLEEASKGIMRVENLPPGSMMANASFMEIEIKNGK
ncbi:MAG: histidine phosphatase family protein [Candidatus Saccharibacteria bacterium]|nr:histidine phosphatase family protein [Candidatus Saccharibacteria bacterium]